MTEEQQAGRSVSLAVPLQGTRGTAALDLLAPVAGLISILGGISFVLIAVVLVLSISTAGAT